MVITQTPFRMSFFGGGTDYPEYYKKYGGAVLSSSFDKYCFVTVRHLPRFFDYKNQVTYGKIERTNTVEEINHPAVREAMRMLDMDELRIVYESDLPARTGLGSSSAFAVGMINAFYALKGKYADKKQLAEKAIYLERVLCNESGGIQDQIAVSYGGFNRIDFDEEGFRVSPVVISQERKKELCNNLMMFYTGISRFSSQIADKQKENTEKRITELQEMKSLVDEAEKILTSKTDLDEFGKLLNYTWDLKKKLAKDITSNSLDLIYERALKNGAYGGKLLGAGGGGFFLFYVDPDKKELLKNELKDLLYVPFQFENSGTRILYYQPEFYERSLN